MHRTLYLPLSAALVASALLVAACQRQPEAAPAPDKSAAAAAATPDAAATTAAEPAAEAHPTDVISEVDNSPGPAGVDARALAGVFTGTVPCADCPGIDTTLGLNADGSFTLREVYQDRGGQGQATDGTWTAEDGGKRIRLDPNGKQLDDRLYRIVSSDELEMLDSDGNAPDSDLDYSLRRSGVAR